MFRQASYRRYKEHDRIILSAICPATFKRYHFDIDDEIEDEYELGVGIPIRKITERRCSKPTIDNLTMALVK
jgi:hypothetical protein